MALVYTIYFDSTYRSGAKATDRKLVREGDDIPGCFEVRQMVSASAVPTLTLKGDRADYRMRFEFTIS